MWEENHRIWGAGVSGWGAKKGRRLIYTEKVWVDDRNQKMEELLRMWRGRKFQVAGAATAVDSIMRASRPTCNLNDRYKTDLYFKWGYEVRLVI